MEAYKELYSYLPYFEGLTGKDSNEITEDSSLFDVSYTEKINEFIACFYDSEFVDTSYTTTLSDYEIINMTDMATRIETADLDLLKAMMTQMIREERFSSGAIASYIVEGYFEKTLKRLGELCGFDDID